MTWFELYILYAIHEGCQEMVEKQKEKPLRKTESLQAAIAKFNSRARKVTLHCAEEGDEWRLKTNYANSNRLEKLGVTNKHASIQGAPRIGNEDAKLIVKALLVMRGVSQKKQKDALVNGTLKLLPRPLAYKGIAHAWVRNLGKLEEHTSWLKELALPD